MENLIEELTKVNPTNLSEDGLKLFNKIMEIIDKNEKLENDNRILKEQKYWCPALNTSGAYCNFKKEDSISKSKVEDFLKRSKIVTNESKNKTYFLIDVTEIKQELLQEGDK